MDTYVLPRFIQYSQRRVKDIVTERDGTFIAVIFDNKEVEIYDLRKETKDRGVHKNTLRLRNVVKFGFMRISSANEDNYESLESSDTYQSTYDRYSNGHGRLKIGRSYRHRRRYKPGRMGSYVPYYHALIVARQKNDEWIRMGVFVEFSNEKGWCEIACTVIKHENQIKSLLSMKNDKSNKNDKNDSNQNDNFSLLRDWDDDGQSMNDENDENDKFDKFYKYDSSIDGSYEMEHNNVSINGIIRPFELPLTDTQSCLMKTYDNVVCFATKEWDTMYLWTLFHYPSTATVRLVNPTVIPIKAPVTSLLITKYAIFHANSKSLIITPLYSQMNDTNDKKNQNNNNSNNNTNNNDSNDNSHSPISKEFKNDKKNTKLGNNLNQYQRSMVFINEIELNLANICQLSMITNCLISGIDINNKLYIIGIDILNNGKNSRHGTRQCSNELSIELSNEMSNNKSDEKEDKMGDSKSELNGWFVHVLTPLPEVNGCCFLKINSSMKKMNNDLKVANDETYAIDSRINGKENENINYQSQSENEMSMQDSLQIDNKHLKNKSKSASLTQQFDWQDSYLMILSMPQYPQIYCILLNKMFVHSLVHCKDANRSVSVTNYPSHLLCTGNHTISVVPLNPDMILLPTPRDINAYLVDQVSEWI